MAAFLCRRVRTDRRFSRRNRSERRTKASRRPISF